MIYSSLAFLGLSAMSCVANPTPDLQTIKANFLQQKQKFHERNRAPTTLTTRLQKLTKMKFKPVEGKLEDLKFDEPNETNLRGLKMKNNFLTYTGYYDTDCTEINFTSGELVNYCYNIQYENSKELGSYLIKVNKKENLIVQLEYDGENCRGVPSKATNIVFPFTSFTGFDTCFQFVTDYDDDNNNDDDFDGVYNIKIGYLSTYPTFGPGLVVGQTYPASECSDAHTHFSSYYTNQVSDYTKDLNMCIVDVDGSESYMTSSASCSIDGQLYYYYYSNPSCSGEPYYTGTYFDTGCTTPTYYDDDNGNDDYYYELGIMETEYCT